MSGAVANPYKLTAEELAERRERQRLEDEYEADGGCWGLDDGFNADALTYHPSTGDDR